MTFLAGFKLALLFGVVTSAYGAGLVKMPVRASLQVCLFIYTACCADDVDMPGQTQLRPFPTSSQNSLSLVSRFCVPFHSASSSDSLRAIVKTGNGQTFDNVLLDTGSPLLWVGGEAPYVPGPSTQK